MQYENIKCQIIRSKILNSISSRFNNMQPLQISQVMNLKSQNLPINMPFNNSNKEKVPMF